jgi:hypothetical protein
VPKDAMVLYRPPGLWETHRSFILIGAGAILFQTTLIAVLVVERLCRRRAEASLRQSEERMSLILEASPNAVVLANEEDQVVLVMRGPRTSSAMGVTISSGKKSKSWCRNDSALRTKPIGRSSLRRQ